MFNFSEEAWISIYDFLKFLCLLGSEKVEEEKENMNEKSWVCVKFYRKYGEEET